jgi:hypothetical protein
MYVYQTLKNVKYHIVGYLGNHVTNNDENQDQIIELMQHLMV